MFGLIEVCLGAVNFFLEESYVLAIVLQAVLVHIAAEVAGFVGQQIFIAFGRAFPGIALRGIGCELFLQLGNLGVLFGCRRCGFRDVIPNEKMTDVNIATELMVDAFQDKFDTALLISADSDLTGPVVAVRQLFPSKRLVVTFPPQRYSEELKKVASAYFTVGRAEIAKSLLPPNVAKADGFILECPPSWQ